MILMMMMCSWVPSCFPLRLRRRRRRPRRPRRPRVDWDCAFLVFCVLVCFSFSVLLLLLLLLLLCCG